MLDKPVIVVTGEPEWHNAAADQLTDDYRIIPYTDRSGYVTRLADDHAALILVNALDPEWRFWTTTPKTSPATRRIPIFLVGNDPILKEAGSLTGADLILATDELLTHLSHLVQDYARIQTPEHVAQMEQDCRGELPVLARQGVDMFNQREFYKQHDLFEELWVQTESPVRDLYRAILQVGVAYYQILRGNYRGAQKMLLRSVQWLAILPDECQGIDVAQFKADAYRVRVELERVGENGLGLFDLSLLKPIRMVKR